MKESQFKKTLIKKLRDDGYTVFDTDIMSSQYPGFPDIIICKNNKTCFAELKTDTGVYTKLQRVFYKKYPDLPIAHFQYFDKMSYSVILGMLRKVF